MKAAFKITRYVFQTLILASLLWINPVYADAGDSDFDPGGDWEGKVVDQIQFDQTGPYSEQELHSLIQIRPGDLYQARLTREAVKRLYETGQFKAVWVAISPIQDAGIALRVHWVKNQVLSSIKIAKNFLFSDKELIKTIGIKPGEWYSETAFKRGIADILTRYRQAGYFQVNVSSNVTVSSGKLQGVHAFLKVFEGMKTRIRRVTFLGKTVFPDLTLGFKIYSNKGEFYKFSEFQEDIRRLERFYEEKGYFRVVVGPGVVTYHEKTNEVDLAISIQPFNQIAIFFEGGTLYSNKRLEALLLIKKERSAEPGVLEGSARQMTRFYHREGYPFAETSTRLKQFPEENRTEAYFTIHSGKRVKVTGIRFSGQGAFSDEVLLEQIVLRESRLFKKIYYTKEAVEKDVAALMQHYRGAGFKSVKVTSDVTFDAEKRHAMILMQIDEGPRTRVKSIEIRGNQALSDDRLKAVLTMRPNAPFTLGKMKRGRQALLSEYSKNGFIMADISPEHHISLDETDVALTYHIAEGEQFRFGAIALEGNRSTDDEVIMRELVMKPGAPYDPGAILESQRRLYKTGHFSSVRFEPVHDKKEAMLRRGKNNLLEKDGLEKDGLEKDGVEVRPTDQDLRWTVRDLRLTVVEKPRISLEFGVGFANRERFRGFIQASHQNVGGTGRSISVRLERSKVEEKYLLIYRKPWFFQKNITARVTASYLDLKEVSFDLETFSVVVGVDKIFSDRLTGSLFYQIERKQTTNVARPADLTPEDEALFTIGSLNPALVYDTRDDPFNPRSGSVNSIVFRDAAKILGSKIQLVKLTLQRRSYHALSSKSVFAFSVRAGIAERFGETEIIPISERFFVGGRNTVRGYDEEKLGIEGETIFNEVPTGGNAMIVLNEEIRFSLPKSLGVVVFLDHGNTWVNREDVSLSDIKSSIGTGLRYNTPIGPFRLDWGFKLNREGAESPSAFHFTLGHAF